MLALIYFASAITTSYCYSNLLETLLSLLYQFDYQSVLTLFGKKVLYIERYYRSSKMFKYKLIKIICRSTFFQI